MAAQNHIAGFLRKDFLNVFLRTFAKNNGSLIIFVILWIVAAASVPSFATLDNNVLILRQASIPAIAAVGMTYILITGGIDLSTGFIVGFASYLVGFLVKISNISPFVSIAAALMSGAFFGFANGFITQKIRVPSFITTLGSGYIIYGLALLMSGGDFISRLPESLLVLGNFPLFGLPMMVYIALVIILIGYFLLHKTVLGRSIISLGSNVKASFLSGINVGRYNVLAYVFNGTLAGLVGVLFTIRVNAAQPQMGGSGFTFEVITAVIVGGTSLFGGVGTVTGSVFGVLIIKMIENCINLLGVSHYLYQAFLGIVILGSIIFENLKNKAL
jgi:ribose/xylose/arabinose/galactoside ABC-type transport system permease subunit